MHDFWPFFVIFWCIFVVFLVNQGDTDCPHVCIAHVSCFQSLLRSLYYLWLYVLSSYSSIVVCSNNTVRNTCKGTRYGGMIAGMIEVNNDSDWSE